MTFHMCHWYKLVRKKASLSSRAQKNVWNLCQRMHFRNHSIISKNNKKISALKTDFENHTWNKFASVVVSCS